MDIKKKVTVSWSGGKDAALALYKIKAQQFEVVSLHTLIDAETKRVGMHGVHEQLIDMQAEQIGIPLEKLYMHRSGTQEEYQNTMEAYYRDCKCREIDGVVFGDIFLEDLKLYRENLLAPFDLLAIYPLWKKETSTLLSEFVSLGFKTMVCAVDERCYSNNILGQTVDENFVNKLPNQTDPCGENGEYHSFVYDGPFFEKAVQYRTGVQVEKKYSYGVVNNGKTVHRVSSFWFQEIYLQMD
ncbi:MAG TPA: diphthine--ammonia ligase [Ohtaekwangia sp.]|nr:diphthine--ammonia ligase [Ohtaekwangia sp.]